MYIYILLTSLCKCLSFSVKWITADEHVSYNSLGFFLLMMVMFIKYNTSTIKVVDYTI